MCDNTRERELTFNNTRGNRVMLKGRRGRVFSPNRSVSQRNLRLSDVLGKMSSVHCSCECGRRIEREKNRSITDT